MHFIPHILLILICTSLNASENCEQKIVLCKEQLTCEKCIQANSCCHFCYDQNFKSTKCDLRENLISNGCPTTLIQDSGGPTRAEIYKDGNQDFTDFTTEYGATQLKPQHLKLFLRKGESKRIQFTYKPTRNYPLDLYYLMDVSYTMTDDIDTITSLGSELAAHMQNLTENFRLALGLYSDKNAMPFSYTQKHTLQQHCDKNRVECVEGFDFKHRLNFTDEINEFIRKVGQLKNETTMNIDEPEAGLDAIMQIMSCGTYMDWLPTSRKIIVMATDGILHWAGDGILAGATKKNFQRCWLDNNGVYTKSLENDYPSLEEIYRKLFNTKTNAVFAAKSNVFEYYQNINKLMPDLTFTARLEEKSKNVIDLVKNGYQNFIKNIKFSTNTTDSEELKVTFRTNCNELSYLNRTQTCSNVVEGKEYVFDVEIELSGNFSEHKTGTTLFIEEQDISEKVAIDIEYIGYKCDCENEQKTNFEKENCHNSEYRCGICNCKEGSTGEFCNLTCVDKSFESCRQVLGNSVSLTCYGRGDCDCGNCICDFGYGGKYCQYLCPVIHRKVCDGHGICTEGKCNCQEGYTGEYCSCLVSKETCMVPGQEECSGRGICKCGKCECSEGYYGAYCEKCPECSGFCHIYDNHVVSKLTDQKNTENGGKIEELVFVEGNFDDIEERCLIRYFKEEENCEAEYKYKVEPKSVSLAIMREYCYKPIAATMKVGIAVAILLAVGVVAIFVYKCYIMRQDRKEYARFENKKKFEMRSENPIYVSPVKTYEIPMEMRMMGDHDKED